MNPDNRIEPTDLSALHTFGLSAKARSVRVIDSKASLQSYLSQVRSGEATFLLGEGSNTLFATPNLEADVWLMRSKGRRYLGVEQNCHLFRLAAGENWHSWVEWSVANGFPGLENMALIPGSVGASPIQNIGAYGIELQDRLKTVHGLETRTGKAVSLSLQDCQFAYRDSIFKHELKDLFLITELDFALPVKWSPVLDYGDLEEQCKSLGGVTPMNVMKAVIRTRTAKLPDPQVLGNSGSFFKNPLIPEDEATALKKKWPDLPVYPAEGRLSKLAAGWLIDRCGLKGFQIGGVQVYEKQALILTNVGGASCADVLAMIHHIQDTVKSQFGVELEPEPNLIG